MPSYNSWFRLLFIPLQKRLTHTIQSFTKDVAAFYYHLLQDFSGMPLPCCHIRKASGFGIPACLYYLDLLRKLANGGFWLTSTFRHLQKMLQCSGLPLPLCHLQKPSAFRLTSTILSFTKALSFPACFCHFVIYQSLYLSACYYHLVIYKKLALSQLASTIQSFTKALRFPACFYHQVFYKKLTLSRLASTLQSFTKALSFLACFFQITYNKLTVSWFASTIQAFLKVFLSCLPI